MLATRDVASFLRYDRSSPLGSGVEHVVGEGQSQCGRFLRTYLHFGLNTDEAGRPALDGVLAHIAGGRRFNRLWPTTVGAAHTSFGHLFPFADLPQTDPMTGKAAGLLDRHQRKAAICRKFSILIRPPNTGVAMPIYHMPSWRQVEMLNCRRVFDATYLHPHSMDRALLNSTTPRSLEALAAILLMWSTIGRSIVPRCRICLRGSPWVNRRRTVHSRWLKMERGKHVVRSFPILRGSASWPVRPRMS